MRTGDIDRLTAGNPPIRGILLRSGGWIDNRNGSKITLMNLGDDLYRIDAVLAFSGATYSTYAEADTILGITLETAHVGTRQGD